MVRKVFYSFHYQFDSWRASTIRNIGVVESNQPASDNKWEEVRRGGEAAIKRWIDGQLQGRTCTIVLVGAKTANRPWIRYEIEQSWNTGKGLFGIRVHKLLDHNQQRSVAGDNPFDRLEFNDGKKLSAIARIYDPPGTTSSAAYKHISDNLSGWIEAAIAAR